MTLRFSPGNQLKLSGVDIRQSDPPDHKRPVLLEFQCVDRTRHAKKQADRFLHWQLPPLRTSPSHRKQGKLLRMMDEERGMNQASFLLPTVRWSLPCRLHLLVNLPGTAHH